MAVFDLRNISNGLDLYLHSYILEKKRKIGLGIVGLESLFTYLIFFLYFLHPSNGGLWEKETLRLLLYTI